MVPVNEDQGIALVGQSEHSSRLVRRGRPRSVSHADIGRDLDQLGNFAPPRSKSEAGDR